MPWQRRCSIFTVSLNNFFEKEFPEIHTIKNISMFELDHIDLPNYELIISTIPLKNYQGKYILVSPILSEEEIQKIKQYLWDINHTENL